LAYSASAGSGKTFALTARYLSLLFMDESPASILAATFTKKAVAEMRHRVIETLRGLPHTKHAAMVSVISEQTGLSRAELIERQPRILARFLRTPNHIVTLDSFFASIVRVSSLEIGLEPTFSIRNIDPETLLDRLLDEAAHDSLLHIMAQLAHQIEDKRFQKIEPLLREMYTADPLLPPSPDGSEEALFAAEETIERERTALIDALERVGTPPRYLALFHTRHPKDLLEKKVFSHEKLGDHSWFKKRANDEIESRFAALKEALARWANRREALIVSHLYRLYERYRNARIGQAKYQGNLAFEDITYFAYRLLYESIDHAFLAFKLDTRFHHILLDEFQDTSTLQFLLLKPLIEEITAGKGQNDLRSFFYVGDTKQSLYRFRGGVEELFTQVAERYRIAVEPMSTNYRSSVHVVERTNRWFSSIMPDYQPQIPRDDAPSGYVHVYEPAPADRLVEHLLERLHHLRRLGIDWDTIAVLVHTNQDGQTVQDALFRAGIPTRLKTSASLRYRSKIAALVKMVEYLYYHEPIDAEALLERTGLHGDDLHTESYNAFMSPLQMLDRLIRETGYFDDDPNILRLLEFAERFDDIPTFLEEFALSDIALAAHTVHGVHIMTIHGSKGLEFDHVIVLDRLGKAKADSRPLLFAYRDDLFIDRLYFRQKGREHVDIPYRTLLDTRDHAARKDKLNLLYVAFTRAVTGLTVLPKDTQSSFLPLDLYALKDGKIEPPEPSEAPSSAPHEPPPVQRIVLHHYGTQERPDTDTDDEPDREAIFFGTALHYALEMIPRFDSEGLNHAIETMRNRYGRLLRPEQIDDIRRRIEGLVADDAFGKLLHGADLRREQSVSYRGEFKQIDLLLDYPDRCVVVDYKSSTKFSAHHREQVHHYVRAIEHITGKPTQGVLVYLLADGIKLKYI
jgi:exodeoxyribonuclease V beta subunit